MASQMYSIVINLISRPSQDRHPLEIEVLIPWLRKRSELFAKMEKDILMRLIENCMYEKVSKDDVIIRQGDRGDCFYIILHGKTSVYIDTVKSDDDPVNTETKSSSPTAHAPWEYLSEEEEAEEEIPLSTVFNRKKQKNRSKLGKFIISFDAGKSFGEIALMTEDAVRNASIVADEDTDLLVIDQEIFNSTLKAKQEEEYKERKDFINRTQLFNGWSSKFKRLCEMSIRKMVVPFETILVKQGEPVQGLYFIVSGQAKILMDMDSHKRQFPKLFDVANSALSKELGKRYGRKEKATKDSVQQAQVRIRRQHGYAAAEKRLAQRAMTLCFVDQSEIIGDAEIALGLDTYAQSIVCTSNTEVFVLDNKNIDRLIYKKNPQTLDVLRFMVEEKLTGRCRTKLGSQVSLYSHILEKLEEYKPKKATLEVNNQNEPPKNPKEDKELMLAQLVKLFIQDRTPFIEPSVPGSVYYRTKSAQRSIRVAMERQRNKKSGKSSERPVTVSGNYGETRLARARKASRRQPRSRRELERLTIAQDTDGMKQLQDRNHAVNRFLHPSNSRRPQTSRPHTSLSTRRSENVESSAYQNGGEPDLPTTENGEAILDASDIKGDAMTQIVLDMNDLHYNKNESRAKIICSMIEKRTNQQQNGNFLRPKSAPALKHRGYGYDSEEDADVFDADTSDNALRSLEDRLKDFHCKHDDDGNSRMTPQIRELRRFQIESPEDVPIPGGTVYVRQKQCKYPSGTYVNPTHHQHVRRFMIPKNALQIATKSLSTMAEHVNGVAESNPNGSHSRASSRRGSAAPPKVVVESRGKSRPQTAPPGQTQQTNMLKSTTACY